MDQYSPRGPLEQMAAQSESFLSSAPPSGPSSDVVSLCPAQDSLSPDWDASTIDNIDWLGFLSCCRKRATEKRPKTFQFCPLDSQGAPGLKSQRVLFETHHRARALKELAAWKSPKIQDGGSCPWPPLSLRAQTHLMTLDYEVSSGTPSWRRGGGATITPHTLPDRQSELRD
ncbi:hypothetical protein NQZ68_010293 [Dissostichus eleginoides]|nr:hypothetical protein NQZ68_010293 [Dissostichus eleginoides]